MAGRVFQLLVVGGGLAQIALASPMPALLTLLEPAGLTPTVSASIAGVDSHGATTYILTESAQTATVVAGPDHFEFNDGALDLACGVEGTGESVHDCAASGCDVDSGFHAAYSHHRAQNHGARRCAHRQAELGGKKVIFRPHGVEYHSSLINLSFYVNILLEWTNCAWR
ncbi:hypothetical protein MVEN_01182900 [Mycena venus]|uniref:Uncharacterized protein n=1 Tax=Mycena venus TaxID=2733690 RepID=A0A8H7CY33_9AGAR|nr:hypothetical protein MVEN_01182900 [Mycena venus]